MCAGDVATDTKQCTFYLLLLLDISHMEIFQECDQLLSLVLTVVSFGLKTNIDMILHA